MHLARKLGNALRVFVTGGKAQARHRDWDPRTVRWTKMAIVLYFPTGGGYIDSEGAVQDVHADGAVIFDGFDYQHAGGPDLDYSTVRVHMVFVRADEENYHKVTDLRPILTRYSEEDSLQANGEDCEHTAVVLNGPVQQQYGRSRSIL